MVKKNLFFYKKVILITYDEQVTLLNKIKNHSCKEIPPLYVKQKQFLKRNPKEYARKKTAYFHKEITKQNVFLRKSNPFPPLPPLPEPFALFLPFPSPLPPPAPTGRKLDFLCKHSGFIWRDIDYVRTSTILQQKK